MAGMKRDPKNPLVQKNFMAPFKLLARLQVLSEKEGVSESEIIRKALERYLVDEAGA
jgi:predicted DNA-binding protein